jgi:hypothetical protein
VAEASFPGRNGKIAIATASWFDCGDCDMEPNYIWTVARGKPAARLFKGWRVAFSPNGRWLASTPYAIQVTRPDGTARRVLGRGFATSPTWSRRGNAVAYVSGDIGIFILRPDGTQKRLIPLTAGATKVAWAPNASELVFGRGSSVWVVGLDGGAPREIARGFDASWSARGQLAYRRGNRLIVTRTPAGAERLVSTGLTFRDEETEAAQPPGYDWSPDGRQIAYQASGGIYAAPAGGGQPRRLARGSVPQWSPDGRLVAYVRGRAIYTVPARGGKSSRFARFPLPASNDQTEYWVADLDWQPLPRH